MQLRHLASLFTITLLCMGGCAITSGLQTYDVPSHGVYQTDLGTQVEVVQITQQALHLLAQQKPSEESSQHEIVSLFQQPLHTYHLSAGDIISIQLWAYPEITPTVATNISNSQSAQAYGFRIDQSGYISFPLVGRVHAAGKTLLQFNQELNHRLAAYLKMPDATVKVISFESQPFSVQGNVLKSGQYYLTDQPLSLYAALGLAGGPAIDGDNSSIVLTRNGQNYQLNPIELEKRGLSLHTLYIQPNDTIYVNSRENQKVYIMGESTKNTAIPLRIQGMSLSDILGESLGINPFSASAKRIYVLRNNVAQQTTLLYHMDLSNFADFGLANQFKIHSNDIVYVDATGLTRWQRVINQLVPFSSALYNLDRLGN